MCRRKISRRRFVGTAAGAVMAASGPLNADPLDIPLGVQVYPVRHEFAKDIAGTLRQLSAMGYQALEMCSTKGYGREDFGDLVDWAPARIRERIEAAGLKCPSCHFGFRELQAQLDDRIAYSQELGLKQMVLSSFQLPPNASLDDWTRAADEFNKMAVKIHKAGMDVGYHNHHFEFHPIDGVLVYERLMSTFDASLIRMQFQVAVVDLGFKAVTFFQKYPGRFISLHLQDWSEEEKKPKPIGDGSVDWKELFTAARTAGVKNYFVEMDPKFLAPSAQFLHRLKV